MIDKKMNGDIQTLQALANYIGNQKNFDKENVLESLQYENDRNKFQRMGFIGNDHIGYFFDMNGENYLGIDVSDENFIMQALDGKEVVSDTLLDKFSDGVIICYGVPVYQNEEIVGALTATIPVSMFTEVIDQSIFAGKRYVHIVNHRGEYVVRSKHAIIKEDMNSVFDTSYIDGDLKQEVLDNISVGEEYFGSFPYKEHNYWVSMIPIGINDWYVFCITPESVINEGFSSVINTFGSILILVFFLFLILYLYIYHILKKNRKSVMNLAYYDSLTGVYNKNKFMAEMLQVLKQDIHYALVI